MSPRFLTWACLLATVATFAVGTINIMRQRVEADTIGSRILRLETSIAFSKKELVIARRQFEQGHDILYLQQRIGDALKPPVPEQVVWIRINPSAASPVSLFSASPRMTAREIAFLGSGGQGGPAAR
jgi:hypothetical protein